MNETVTEYAQITPRGALSAQVLERLSVGVESHMSNDEELVHLAEHTAARSPNLLHDDDAQLALFLLYANSYGSLPQLDAQHEWNVTLIRVRTVLETHFEHTLRQWVPLPDVPSAMRDAVATALFALTAERGGPSLARYFAKEATQAQALEFLIQRSIYTLREADPHSWAIPRLTKRPKAALVEIQSDEYGGGRPQRVHATLFANAMRGAGLSDTYGAYLDLVPAITLSSLTTMSLFGMNRRLLGAIVGHLAAFEMTSSLPNRSYANGFRRLGFGEQVTDYFDEHVEADAVHEQIAARDLAGTLAEDHPELLTDIMFGASACLTVDGMLASHMLQTWQNGLSSLSSSTLAYDSLPVPEYEKRAR